MCIGRTRGNRTLLLCFAGSEPDHQLNLTGPMLSTKFTPYYLTVDYEGASKRIRIYRHGQVKVLSSTLFEPTASLRLLPFAREGPACIGSVNLTYRPFLPYSQRLYGSLFVEYTGIEPAKSCLQNNYSPLLFIPQKRFSLSATDTPEGEVVSSLTFVEDIGFEPMVSSVQAKRITRLC